MHAFLPQGGFPPRPPNAGRVALSLLLLLVLSCGALSHLHASRVDATDHCTACALHETTSALPTALRVAVDPTFTLASSRPARDRPADPCRTLLEAPKTSPPV
jgi:hypothetical protein